MTQTISRIYASREQAAAAAAALKKNPVWADDTYMVEAAAIGDGSVEALTAAIMQAFIPRAEAAGYAEEVAKGGVLVTVHAPFGTAMAAIETLERFDPIQTEVEEAPAPAAGWDPAAPFSANMLMQVLLNDPAPCSRFWNMPTLLSPNDSLSRWFGIPELLDHTKSLSERMGWALLSNKPTPLSDWLKLPLLKDLELPGSKLPALLAAPAEPPPPAEPPAA